MAEIDNALLYEILKKLQADIAQVGVRLDKLEARMANLEKRQTAPTHFEQSVLAHLASIHDSIDNLRGEMTGIDRRVTVLELR